MGKLNLDLHSTIAAQLVGTLMDHGAKAPDPAVLRMLVTRALAAGAKA